MSTNWYVDAVGGTDLGLGNGTALHPYQTINKAISVTVTGDKIILASGVYRETVALPNDKDLHIYGRGMCIIDGEALRRCVTIGSGAIGSRLNVLFENIIFRNGSTAIMELTATNTQFVTPAIVLLKCSAYQDSTSPAVPLLVTSGDVTTFSSADGLTLAIVHCTIKRLSTLNFSTAHLTDTGGTAVSQFVPINLIVVDSIIDVTQPAATQYMVATQTINSGAGSGTLAAFTQTEGTLAQPLWTSGFGHTAAYAKLDMRSFLTMAAQGAVNAFKTVNITSTPPPYTTDSYPNPDLSLNRAGTNIALFIGTGQYKGNICGEWFPVYGWDVDVQLLPAAIKAMALPWRDPVSGSEWVTDPNYVDGNTKGPALRRNDENGDHIEIDTQTQASATSVRWLGPVITVPVRTGAPITVKRAMRQGVEDTAPSAGSKKVIDSTISTSTRTMQYRASVTPFGQTVASGGSVPAFVDVDFVSNYAEAFTETFYLQEALILTSAGN